jgi:hypothetical protein
MKKIALISALALSGLFYNKANAQIRISLGLHLPVAQVAIQAPVYADYNSSDDYYYLPDVDAYYSVAEQCYYYNDGVNWTSAAYLPGEYRDYDWRNARRYEVRAHRPYLNANFYRERFRGNVGNWSHYDNQRNDNYANRDFNRDDHRVNALHADQRNQSNSNRGEEHADNRSWDNGNRDSRFDNRGQDNRNQDNRGWNNGNRDNRFDNRNQGNQNQPSQPDRSNTNQQPNRNQGGNGQPSNQNGRDRQPRDNGAGQQHFTDNSRGQNTHDRFRS